MKPIGVRADLAQPVQDKVYTLRLKRQVVNLEKYNTEQLLTNHNGTIFNVKNLIPIIHKDEREELKHSVEECLYKVFSKYKRK